MRASDRSSPETTITPAGEASPAPPRPSAKRFSLDGPTRAIDRRVNAARADIADVALAGHLFAPHYAAPQRMQCLAASAMLRCAPEADARAVSELLLGEAFDVIDLSGGWAWGSCVNDRYVGYVRAEALGEAPEPDTIVTARHALLFADADIKAPVRAIWSMGARFAGRPDGAFWRTDEGFVHQRHAAPLAGHAADPVAVAQALLGTPYRWGGRSADGIDCSGLVQLAFGMAGIALQRDSDQQRESAGVAIPAGAALRRADLVFFPGHVGIMIDPTLLIHANAHAMAVTIEPLADVVARLAPDHAEPILARRRLAA